MIDGGPCQGTNGCGANPTFTGPWTHITHDASDVAVVIRITGFKTGSVASMILTDGQAGNAALISATLGGATINNNSAWEGKWTRLDPMKNGETTLTVQSTTAVIVKIHANQ